MKRGHRYLKNWGFAMDDRIYCYEGSDVLINKLGIHDAGTLAAAERKLTGLRLLELMRQPVQGDFDLQHLCCIHRHIFQDLYAWAGSLRDVDIAKGTLFCKAEYLDAESARIFNALGRERTSGRMPPETAVKTCAYYFSEINALHPFREGNGRAQREFIRELALTEGYIIEFYRVTEEEMLYASRESFLWQLRADGTAVPQMPQSCHWITIADIDVKHWVWFKDQ